jgi:hypothetical protein
MMEAGNKYLESESDVLVVLLQSSSESQQSTELGLSMSELGVSTTLDEFTTVEILLLEGSLKLTMTGKETMRL